MEIQIRYEGFTVAGASRSYNFLVIDTLGDSRHYTVLVPMDSFRSTPLRFQDGPPICFQRLKQELDRETPEPHPQARLSIGEPEIHQYLERYYPPRRSFSSRPPGRQRQSPARGW